MVRELTSTVDGDEAPSMVDGGVALRGSFLNAPRNLFTATSYSRQKWWQAPQQRRRRTSSRNLLLTATTNGKRR